LDDRDGVKQQLRERAFFWKNPRASRTTSDRGTGRQITRASLRRRDNEYEFGAGLVWPFAGRRSLRPENLYLRDQSNSVSWNYSSNEAWVNVR
jgi:uncharacterized protein with von Willebrand factor type A (vWA) domain